MGRSTEHNKRVRAWAKKCQQNPFEHKTINELQEDLDYTEGRISYRIEHSIVDEESANADLLRLEKFKLFLADYVLKLHTYRRQVFKKYVRPIDLSKTELKIELVYLAKRIEHSMALHRRFLNREL